MNSTRNKLVSPILMWLIFAVGILPIFIGIPSQRLIPKNAVTPLFLPLAIIYWLYFFLSAIAVHRQAAQNAEAINKIIKEKIYSLVRHPIYSADIVLFWGIFLFWPDLKVLTAALWASAIIILWSALEEKALIRKFGKEYLEYREKTPMFIPKKSGKMR